MAHSLALSESALTRYVTGALMYFAQGIPYGLLSISIPAWLASEGVSPGAIGSYLAVVILPWAFKLVTGPFMDRFQLPSMGLRRPWVLAAQFGLTMTLLAMAFITNPIEQMGQLMAIGFLINVFAASQDVAVDGMAIDLTPVREQGRLNGFMSFGKAAGWSLTAAATGYLLVNQGPAVTAVFCAAVAGIIFVMAIFVLERPGERHLPWSQGEARSGDRPAQSFGAVFGGLNKVLWSRASLVVMGIMLMDGLATGYGQALMPVAAINLFGYTTPQWSGLVAMTGLIGAGLALGLGPLIDRFGAKRMMILTASLVAVHAFLVANTQVMWEDAMYVRIMLSLWVMMVPVVMVCAIALAMAVCNSGVSATQFAIYMSTANLGHAVGSKLFGVVADGTPFHLTYMLLGSLVVLVLLVLFVHRSGRDDEGGDRRPAPPRYTLSPAGGGAGIFFSGAIRCPKCRAEMDSVTWESTEVDRCKHCGGLWFDAGEIAALNNPEAATALDIGNARTGRRLDVIQHYRCPRCGGKMQRTHDPEQPHIGFENCVDCNGSFLDAGEFLDLTQHTFSDTVKRWLHREH